MAFADVYDLPIDDSEHRSLRDGAWIGGTDEVCLYYMSWLCQINLYRVSKQEFDLQLHDVIQNRLPRSSWLLKTLARYDFMAVWLKAQYRFSEENRCYPITKETKEERSLVLLLEDPTLTDEEIQPTTKATEKTMRRWSTYNYARREMRFVAEGLRNDS